MRNGGVVLCLHPNAMMALVGFHGSHEQHAPSALLQLAQQAEAAGFTAAMCSDHFAPWSLAQGHSGFTWSWLGAALATTRLSFGTVCAPGQRYHPAIIAQAAATLSEMYPGRFWIALGSGEALNESITGDAWPPKAQRQRRLRECADVMRALWAGETVTHDGLVRVKHARLYSRPAQRPPLLVAALTPETARWAAGWADGVITVNGPRDRMREIVDAFHEGGGDGKPLCLQVALAFEETDAASAQMARSAWRQAALPPAQLADLETPEQFDRAAAGADLDAVLAGVRASADVERQLAWLQEDLAMGFTTIYLHNVNTHHERFFQELAPRALELGSA
jgi:probable non-F420 flavinoid oxidoreductase